jgi:hypothetical protein
LAHKFGEPVEKRPLAFENFRVSGRQIKPLGAIDLRKGLHLSAFRRPLDFERVASYGLNVDIALDGEGKHALAAPLANLAKRFKWLAESKARFLPELSTGGVACVFVSIHFAFRD